MKTSHLFLAACVAGISTLHAQPVANPKMAIPLKGFVIAESGERIEYSRAVNREKYFAGLDSEVYRLTFSPDKPLPNNSGSKMMLANLIVGFYKGPIVHQDAVFATRFEEWKPATKIQEKGYYIQCTNYPMQRIWIDLRLSDDGDNILEAIISQGAPI
jgi:hypothetical protein